MIKSAVLVTKQAKGTKYGYDKHSAREGLSSLFYDQTFNIAYQQHAVERIRKLFANSLNYVLPDGLGDYGIATHFAKNLKIQPLICLRFMRQRERISIGKKIIGGK
ncbi:ADP-heptose:LPS heptosyl transferase I [Actinobacillus equuli]|nr:ADP-heptose:LPS heptosyl transferase I [Actinobacillus equuli]